MFDDFVDVLCRRVIRGSRRLFGNLFRTAAIIFVGTAVLFAGAFVIHDARCMGSSFLLVVFLRTIGFWIYLIFLGN